MLLHTVIVPPSHILEPVAEVVRAAALAATPEELAPRRGFLRRSARRANGTPGRSDEAATSTASEQLLFLPPTAMSLPIAGFGNVTSADAIRLADALQTAAAGTPGATVRIAGGTALEFTDDRNVWARLEGDVDGLRSMAREVTQVVEQHGFFVDRRRFRPMMCVGTRHRRHHGALPRNRRRGARRLQRRVLGGGPGLAAQGVLRQPLGGVRGGRPVPTGARRRDLLNGQRVAQP